jgi:hypothetical protein
MRDEEWDESCADLRPSYPYSVDFACVAAPADSLNSLESARLFLTVRLLGADNKKDVQIVAAKLTNEAKKRNLDSVCGPSELKRKTTLSTRLVQDNNKSNSWIGVVGVPVTWTEGGTSDYERSGSWCPKSKGDLFTMEITYKLTDGISYTARFSSEDVFHWMSRSTITNP